ncbi:hypothetical protein PV703_07575 [Streptomyces sp. ME01-24h]|nr:hypothetical protein [Streptomyces sp. ME19-03-3]MDX3353180.1 hypothetical protein [Streptomyces sp. ME01-24h]
MNTPPAEPSGHDGPAPKPTGGAVAVAMQDLAQDVRGAVIRGAGHWVAEQAPEEMLAELGTFLAPYRRAAGAPAV